MVRGVGQLSLLPRQGAVRDHATYKCDPPRIPSSQLLCEWASVDNKWPAAYRTNRVSPQASLQTADRDPLLTHLAAVPGLKMPSHTSDYETKSWVSALHVRGRRESVAPLLLNSLRTGDEPGPGTSARRLPPVLIITTITTAGLRRSEARRQLYLPSTARDVNG